MMLAAAGRRRGSSKKSIVGEGTVVIVLRDGRKRPCRPAEPI